MELLQLIIELWWLLAILFGVIFFFGGLYRSLELYLLGLWASWTFVGFLALAAAGCLVTVASIFYLEFTPLQKLQLSEPPSLPLLPAVVDMVNNFLLPILKNYWSLALLLYSAWVLNEFRPLLKERRRSRRPGKKDIQKQRVHSKLIYNREKLSTMEWLEFERLCAHFFHRLGYQVVVTRSSKDGGIDLRLKKDNRRAVVQCKRYAIGNSVGVQPVRELYGVMHSERADYAYFVTTSHFSKPARQFAKDHPTIKLIDGDQFISTSQKLGILPEGDTS